MKRLIPIVLAVCSVLVFGEFSRAASPTDLAKENADLKEYAAKLEARISELEAKLKGVNPPSVPKVAPPNTFRFIPPPTPPRFPEGIQPPGVPQVAPFISPQQSVPDDWIKRQFNGRDLYLIPLK